MRLNMDLVRAILLQIQVADIGRNTEISVEVPPHSAEEVNYHIRQLVDAGVVRALEIPDLDDATDWYKPTSMTWQGHQFVESIRDNRVWNKVKSLVVEKGGALTVEIIGGLAKQVAKSLLGLS